VRKLDDAPQGIAEDGEVRFGSFRGGLPRMDFGPVPQGKLWQLTHRKQWTYALVVDEHVLAAAAVVSLGWAATALVFVLDRASGSLVVDRSTLGPGTLARFCDGGAGERASYFELGRTRLDLRDGGMQVDLTHDCVLPTHFLVRTGALLAPPIAAVVPVEGGYANATEKRIVRAEGEIVAGGRRYVLRDALCGFDHTAGYLARHTAWRWAMGMGRTTEGLSIGLNLVEGFVGEAECGVWIDGELVGVEEGRFDYDLGRPLAPWRVRSACGAVDLVFAPAAVHDERKDLLVARSQFIQPLGAYSGTIRVGGRTHWVEGLPGVTEHQDVVW